MEVWGSIPHCSTTVRFANNSDTPRQPVATHVMEAAIALALALGLAALALARAAWSAVDLLFAGAGLTATGAMLSAVGGLGYHASLLRTLGRRGALPRGWVWRPTDLHRLLRPAERARVLPWFVLGPTGFVAVVLGGLLVLFAAGADMTA